MSVHYCEKWFRSGSRPIGMIEEHIARARHAAREPYTALLGGAEQPTHVISLAGPWVTVSFLDGFGREYLTYDFKETQPRRLFLTMATHRGFFSDRPEPTSATRFAFQENGRVLIERRDLASGETQERESSDEVSANWEDYPSFGSYEAIVRRERVQALPR
jgi:hypothetical protein